MHGGEIEQCVATCRVDGERQKIAVAFAGRSEEADEDRQPDAARDTLRRSQRSPDDIPDRIGQVEEPKESRDTGGATLVGMLFIER